MIELIADNPDISLEENSGMEMTPAESRFLLELFMRKKPAKILEVGVAAGGTSALLLKNMAGSQRLYSIDLATSYYRSPDKSCCYLVEEKCTEEERSRHTLITGYDIIQIYDRLGKDFDFVILDTTHHLPGELLTYIVVNKLLAPDAIIVLHDISLHLFLAKREMAKMTEFHKRAFATNVLLAVVASRHKFLPEMEMPNIGAFVADEQSAHEIGNLFLALTLPWAYDPGPFLKDYLDFIYENYNRVCYDLFKKSLPWQSYLFPEASAR